MAESSTQSIVISAPCSRVAEVICDFARYPEWTEAVREAEVLTEYEDGYAHTVRFVIDAGVLADDYTLVYSYAEDLTRIEWQLAAPSRMQRRQNGSYDLVDNGDGGCTVTYTLAVELAVATLGMFRRKAEKMIMDTALKQLKRRVEADEDAR
ncbi:SRPBCC family protein [Plantactinospora siamensis]|uniref:SRPBCC family protein n=1 Tax=Plantactinospora siamensis TaxID=555372 RepID=A0ABV6NZS7_9ACTN